MLNGAEPYTSGTKAWKAYSTPVGSPADVVTLPMGTPFSSFTPYRLIYQLAQSVDEVVTYEGSLMLHEGDNQIEVGTGIIVREAVNPQPFGDGIYINNNAVPTGRLKNRTNSIRNVFKESQKDKKWTILANHAAGNGGGQAYTSKSLYDPTSAYSVTYLALDTYAIGIAPDTISAEYAPNIRESVESLVRELVEARTESSVLQNTKAQKQQPKWIEGTLINEFTGAVRYTQSDNGLVSVQFTVTISNTTLNTLICRLPKDYLPYASVVSAPTVNNNTGSTGAGFGINRTLGGLVISGTPHFNVGQVVVGQITYRKHMGE